MSTAASATPPTRCWKNAWPRSKAAAAPSPPPAARRRCTWRSRTLAGAGSHIVASSRAVRRQRTTCCTTRCRASASPPPSSSPATSTAGAPPSGPNTRLLFGETLGNPGLDVLDIPTVSAIAHDAGLPLLVDSTFTTPWLMKPFDHGADLILPLGHQVPVRPRHGDRRRAGRQRPLRLGQVGPLPRAERALCRLPRHGVQRRKQRRRLPAARAARRACATSAPA